MPINFRLVAPEIRYIVEHCEARAFIVQDELVTASRRFAATLAYRDKAMDPLRRISTPPGWTAYEALIARRVGQRTRRRRDSRPTPGR